MQLQYSDVVPICDLQHKLVVPGLLELVLLPEANCSCGIIEHGSAKTAATVAAAAA
jgi:hypothetical protein